MRKTFLITLLFFFQNILCQEYQYHFDTFLEYKGVSGFIRSSFINSANDSYLLNISHGDETMYGRIWDYRDNVMHEFEAIQDDNIITFKYLYSRKIYNNNQRYKHIDISEKAIDSTKKEYKIVIFDNKKRTKINCKIDFTIEDSNDLFPNRFLKSFTHGRLANSDFKVEKGILSKIKVEFRNGHNNEAVLFKNQKTNTLLTITKEQIHYKQ